MLALPVCGLAVESCKVMVNARDGALLVSAKAVAANPRWGFTAVGITTPFANEGTCVVGGSAKKCELGASGSAARITPPDLCTLYVTDESATVCAAYIKGCVPGVRTTVQGEPGPPGPPGPPGVQGAPGAGTLVKDANGQTVGALASLGNNIVILRNVDGKTVGPDGAFYYESGNCTGPALMPTSSPFADGLSILLYTVATVRSGQLYYAPGVGQSLTANSRDFEDSGCQVYSSTANFAAPVSTDVSTLLPPFHVEVQP
jgi:hypothetical protein